MVRGSVVALALVVAAVVGAASSRAGADGRRGKVVRVERRTGGGTPRFCSIQLNTGDTICIGPSIKVGETIVAVSQQHHGAILRVTEVEPYSQTCPTAPVWKVTVAVGDDAASEIAKTTGDAFIGFIDGGLDPRRSVVMMPMAAVSHRPDSTTAWGIDRDGDGRADLAIEEHACDSATNPTVDGPYSCYEVWAASGREWKRVRADVFDQSCK